MDKLTKDIIDYMNSHLNSSGDCWCSISPEWDNESDIPIGTLSNAVNTSVSDVQSAIKYLCENHLAEYRYLSSRTGKMSIAFHLKHTGRHYKEISSLTTKQKWKERGIGAGVTLLIWLIQELIKYYSPI